MATSNTSLFCVEKVLEQVTALAALQGDWDGYGAKPIDAEIIEAASDFSRWLEGRISVAPIVVPLSNGRLQFEWHDDPRTLELEFASPEKIHYLKWNPEAAEEEEDVISVQDRLGIVELLQWFDRVRHG